MFKLIDFMISFFEIDSIEIFNQWLNLLVDNVSNFVVGLLN
jgi:hypothetical protein